MAIELTICRLDDEPYRKLKIRAARRRRSAEAEVRETLRQMLTEGEAAVDNWLRRAEALARTMPRLGVDSADLIREERDSSSGLSD
jgi:plasmid stability protein